MTPQEFMLKWSPIVALSTQNKALSLAFMLEVKQMVDEATKAQQNAAEELIQTVDEVSVMKPHADEYAFMEIQKAIGKYRTYTK